MTPERWAQVKMVMSDALEQPSTARATFLERACAGDTELRREVESLLASADDGDSVPEARNAVAGAAKSVAMERDADLRSFLEGALGRSYEILRPLGRGGMGAVYLARERALDRFVAIKVLRPDLASAPESRERFRREARIAAQLTHPGILPLYTFGEVDGLWYFVMGYVRGESLAERLRLEGRMAWSEAHHILVELADALECAHRHGVVHRDIKPANILLDEETGHTILADFGISKTLGGAESLTQPGAVMGTPDYMSPEQALGAPDVDERSDIYSLGAVAYRMLTGREPFGGLTVQERMSSRVTQDPTPLKELAPSVPDSLAPVVMQCLARDRSARWRDARTLKEALARAGTEATETLPEGIRDLPSFGAYAMLWAVAWTAFAVLSVRPVSEKALLLLIAVMVPLGLVLHVWNIGRHGLGPLDLIRVAYWPPEWWGMWWPRVLRRPSDLWPRLPWPARAVRVVLSAFFVAVPGLMALKQWLVASGRVQSPDTAQLWFITAESTVIAGTATVVTLALLWARRLGLSTADAVRVLFGGTAASTYWTAPRISRVLAPAVGRVRPPDRDVATDHRRAILELIPLLGAEATEAGRAAAVAVERVVREIEDREREIAILKHDAPASEIDRLESRLASLGGAEGPPDESREHRELRELVRHQLELVRRMRARHELLSQQRARLLDLVRALWTQLCVTSDAAVSAVGAPGGGRATERVLSLCSEIAQELQPTTQGITSPVIPSGSG